MLRQKQERIGMRAPESPCDGTNPGRSARSRYAAYPEEQLILGDDTILLVLRQIPRNGAQESLTGATKCLNP